MSYERYYRARRIKAFLLLSVLVVVFIASLLNTIGLKIAYASVTTGTVNGDGVRVRTTPRTDVSDNIVTQVSTGDSVVILETDVPDEGGNTQRVWCKIEVTKGTDKYVGYIASEFVSIDVIYTPDMDFEQWLDGQGFPESYKPSLRQLHAKYPKWIFIADKLDYTFEEVLEAQNSYARSLINASAISSWKSMESESYDWVNNKWYTYDGDKWNLASKEIIAFALDPRNYLDSTHIFAFEQLSYDARVQNEEGLNSIISNTFMKETGTIGDKTLLVDDDNNEYTYAQALMMAGLTSKVSPYHLATRIVQEVSIGSDGASDSITGTLEGYEGYYNYYNIKAAAGGGFTAIQNGLIYAKEMGWNKRLKAIVEGACTTLGKNYISIGQDTLYYEKFDLIGTPFTHQYMTYVMAPYQESVTESKAYSEEMRKDTALTFKIPVYKDLPQEVCEKPTKSGNPNNILKHMEVVGQTMTPAFSYIVNSYNLIVPYEVEKVNVYAAANADTSKVTGNGDIVLEVGLNTVNVICTAENGDERTYTIEIYREEKKEEEKPIEIPKTFNTTLNIDVENGCISGIEPESTVSKVM
ncbi:MAG: cadherin-like beta sandwich domain-containing protein, partial [Lachnospiraceae bacterium]